MYTRTYKNKSHVTGELNDTGIIQIQTEKNKKIAVFT